MSVYHTPVMLKECLEGLNIKPDGIYVDVTFGPCIIPGVPSNDSGYVGDLIGNELTQLYNYQALISDTTSSAIPVQTKNETFLLNNDSVLIEIIAIDDKYDSVKVLVQTLPYGMTDLIYNGN